MAKVIVPPYCNCTPEEFAAAKAEYERERKNVCFFQVAGVRRSALAAQMNSNMFIAPKLAIEFAEDIEAKNYKPRTVDTAFAAAQVKAENEKRVAALKQQAEEAKKPRRLTLRQASESMNAIDYDIWLKSEDGQLALKEGWV